MTQKKIKTTIQAELDIENIKHYIECDNKLAAKKLILELREIFITLSDYPNLGKHKPEFWNDDSILFFTVEKRYLIVYKIDNDTLLILRVLNTYQNICEML